MRDGELMALRLAWLGLGLGSGLGLGLGLGLGFTPRLGEVHRGATLSRSGPLAALLSAKLGLRGRVWDRGRDGVGVGLG